VVTVKGKVGCKVKVNSKVPAVLSKHSSNGWLGSP